MNVFPLFIGFGAALGLGFVTWQAPEKLRARRFDTALWVLAGALVGGRAGFVAISWPYFQHHPAEILQVWLGGFSGMGAFAGALAALALTAAFTRQRLDSLADAFLPLGAALSVFGWLACWLSGDAYGLPASGWLGLPARDEWGAISARLPVQLLGALLSLLMFWLVGRLPAQWKTTGLPAALWLFAYSLALLGLSFLRADPAPTWRGIRLEALVEAGIAFLAAISVCIILVRKGIQKG